eukprot:49266_1
MLSVLLFIFINIINSLPPDPPSFSWDTIPLFIHAGNGSGSLNATAAKYMSTFPLATLPQAQGGPNGHIYNCTDPEKMICEEDAQIMALAQIKSYNTTTRTLFYLNSFYNLPQYNLSRFFYGANEKYLLHYKGKLAYTGDCNPNKGHSNTTIFDLSQNETRNAWLNTVKYAMTHSLNAVDGIFSDRGRAQLQEDLSCLNWTQQQINDWDNGHILMIQQAMDIVRNANPSRGIIIPNGADIDKVNGIFYENFAQNDSRHVPPGNDLNNLMNDYGIRISEVHKDKCNPLGGDSNYNTTLASYLIGAYKFTYFACTKAFSLQNDWDIIWQNKDYKKPLGEPLSNATYNKQTQTYYRAFAKGVKVWLDYEWQYPCIKWADGSMTGTNDDCKRYEKHVFS